MNPAALVTQIRDHYVDQLRVFIARQRQICTKGGSEVKLQLGDQSKVFSRLYCADFIKNDGAPEVVELRPEHSLSFAAVEGTFGRASLRIEHLEWDNVLLRHDINALPAEGITRWFQQWFDPDDERRVPVGELSGCIHSLLLQHDTISIDLGTAPADAFWDILQMLEEAGATRILVSSSNAGADSSAQ
jgi:hypothetical protein